MPTECRQVSASNQDCQVYQDLSGDWQFELNNTAVAIGYHGPDRRKQGSGLYFPDIPIPAGSKIHQAFLILRSKASNHLPEVHSMIEVEDNATPAVFTTLADYQARDRWIYFVWWNFLYKTWAEDTLYVSPDIAILIQKVIDLPAWVQGNPLVLFWNDENGVTPPIGASERIAYSYLSKPSEAARLEITFSPPAPPPPPALPDPPVPPPPPRKGWAALNLEYEYLDDGFKLTLHTDVPCHCYCRMTTTPPRKHVKPVMTRGLRTTGDIRFCFVVYEDNEQEEEGDTLIHTFLKPNWPVCETRWFYFVGVAYGDTSESETAIFKFHFPAPPPEPPPPITKLFYAKADNRTIQLEEGFGYTVLTVYGPPQYALQAGCYMTGGSHYIYRSFLNFDLSTMALTAKIISAKLQLYVFFSQNDQVAKGIITQHGTQNIPITTADWNSFDGTLFYRKQFPMTLNAYNDWPFSSVGINSLKANVGSANYKLCDRGGLDYDGGFHGAVHRNMIGYYSQQKGSGYQPCLEITYYPA